MPPRIQLDEDDETGHSAQTYTTAPDSVYRAVYSPLRYRIHKTISDEVERETPVLVAIQQRCRTPVLDKFFILTGMLGNHTFFFLALPVLHIFGLGPFARGLTDIVLWSVYFSGVAKDYVSTSRPKSPPVKHITRSPAHTLEYGFPSSHTTYVVSSIAYVSYYMLCVWDTSLVWIICLWVTGACIVFGRIYCGLHSFVDVAGGATVGLIQAAAFVYLHGWVDSLMMSVSGPLYMFSILYMALSTLPRALDQCPCCVDIFCATSVTIGIHFASWCFARSPVLWLDGQGDRIAWNGSLTLMQNMLRIFVCVAPAILWKLTSKPLVVRFVANLMESSKEDSTSDDDASDCDSSCTEVEESNKGCENVGKDAAYVVPSQKEIRDARYGTYSLIYSVENLARVPIYGVIGFIVAYLAPVLYHVLGLTPK